jgi:hypothetical protein
MSDLPSREIIREHEFDEQLSALIGDPESADKFTAAAEDLLARLPRSGMLADEEEAIWDLSMTPVGNRRVTLFYTFDERVVIFLSILPFDD